MRRPRPVLFVFRPTSSTGISNDSQMIFTAVLPRSTGKFPIISKYVERSDSGITQDKTCGWLRNRSRTDQSYVSRKKLLQRIHEAGDDAIQIFIGSALSLNFVDGVKHGRVVLAAKLTSDLRQRRGSELLDDIHSHLPRKGNSACVAAHLQVLLTKIEMFADAFLDQINCDALLLRSNNIAQHLLRGSQRYGGAGQRGIGHQSG